MIIIKQDKGREVVIKDKPKYNEKCLLCLDAEILEKLNYDSIKKKLKKKYKESCENKKLIIESRILILIFR